MWYQALVLFGGAEIESLAFTPVWVGSFDFLVGIDIEVCGQSICKTFYFMYYYWACLSVYFFLIIM